MRNLIELQALEFGRVKDKSGEAAVAKLRGKIPPQILSHYDRLMARGKKGLAQVHNQVCTGCHMRLPVAVINTLMRGEDIQLCDSCGRYLYLLEGEGPSPELLTVVKKPAVQEKPAAGKARKRKTPKQDA